MELEPLSQEKIIQKPLFYYDYLSDESCEEIEKIINNNFFSNRSKQSLIHYQPIRFETERYLELPPIKNKNEQDYMKKKTLKSKKEQKAKHINTMSADDIGLNTKYRELRKILLEKKKNSKGTFKMKLPRLAKKKPIDRFPINYKPSYIDQVENNFIKPYLSKDNIVYDDFIENKQSRIPFNFIINY